MVQSGDFIWFAICFTESLCLRLDIWVPKLVEAENEGILEEVENGT